MTDQERITLVDAATIVMRLRAEADSERARLAEYHRMKAQGIKPPVGMFREWQIASQRCHDLITTHSTLQQLAQGKTP